MKAQHKKRVAEYTPEQKEAYDLLRRVIGRPHKVHGRRLYTLVRHVSRSGMLRAISVYCIYDRRVVRLDYWISNLTGFKFDKNHGGLRVEGCGMDMCFHVVYTLSCELYGDGYALNKCDL